MSVKKFFQKLVRYVLCVAAGMLAFAACGYTDYRLWPLDLPASAHPRVPVAAIQDKRLVIPFSPGVPAAEIATFNDQLEAFLRFEYLRGREARAGHDTSHMLLTAVNTPKDRKSTRLNSSHITISYAAFCLKKISLFLVG